MDGFIPRNINDHDCIFYANLLDLSNYNKRAIIHHLFERFSDEYFPRYFLPKSRLSLNKIIPLNDHKYCEMLHHIFFEKNNRFLHNMVLKPDIVEINKIEFGIGIKKKGYEDTNKMEQRYRCLRKGIRVNESTKII